MPHHPIFSRFDTDPPPAESPAHMADFIGARFRHRFNGLEPQSGSQAVSSTLQDRSCPRILPAYDEEYFEWIDLLESVDQATDSYTMFELGAGYGRWTVRSVLAARQKGIGRVRTISVEAEPSHAAWMGDAFADNGMMGDDHRIIEAAVSANRGSSTFLVVPPSDWNLPSPADWYGQTLSKGMSFDAEVAGEFYGEKPIVRTRSGWGGICVETVTLPDILAGVGLVDLIDMDIQGTEAEVVADSIDCLTQQVKRLHIGTHSSEIDASLMEILSKENWKNVRAYRCGAEQETPYGTIAFQDGVQTWINPSLS